MNKRIRKKHRDKKMRAWKLVCKGLNAVNTCPSYPWYDVAPKAAPPLTLDMMLKAKDKMK